MQHSELLAALIARRRGAHFRNHTHSHPRRTHCPCPLQVEEEAIHCGKLRIFQWAPSMISADVLSENIDFPFELFVFAAVFIDLQLCLGGIFQILGQLAADVIGIELDFSRKGRRKLSSARK